LLALHVLRFMVPPLALAFALAFLPARAAQPSVPYVPTPQAVVDRMLEMGKVGAGDYLIDLGSGDGRIVVSAAKKFGTRGFGVDLDSQRIAEANANARTAGVTDKVAFYQRDLFETDLSAATVITMYLLPRVNMQLRPRLLDLKPGTRIVSHDFSMEDWQPEEHVRMPAPDKYGGSGGTSDIYLWLVPAKAAGAWRWELPLRGDTITYELDAQQRFQTLTGTVRVAGQRVPLESARLKGDTIELSFTANVHGAPVRHRFSGRIDGGAINGSGQLAGARLQSELQWEAQRKDQ